MRPIRVIAYFEKDGSSTPVKFQISSKDAEDISVKVDRVIYKTEGKIAGNRMILYQCQSVIDGKEKRFELKYEISTCKWYLFKM
jgi:hypothetical protein